MPIDRLSTTCTGVETSFAASSADSTVADIAPERCTETISSAPSSASRW